MRVYADLEFHSNGKRIRPLSIALVDEAGGELYRVFADDDAAGRAMGDPWLRGHVMPYLPVEPDGKAWRWDTTHPDWPLVQPRDVIAADVAGFVLARPDPELWGDYCAFDYVAISQMFGMFADLPAGFPMFMCDLRREWRRLGCPDLPVQETGVHHALHDARHERRVGVYLAGWELALTVHPATCSILVSEPGAGC